jgi:hypothetical protein
MRLPKIDKPIYEVYLKSLDKKVKFHPFTVKEEKLLLMAITTENATREDEVTALNAIKQVANNCLIDNVDVDALPIFDLEMLFLNLRARSINEMAKIKFVCNNTIKEEDGEKPCRKETVVDFNILDAKIIVPEGHDSLIRITDTIAVKMKYTDLNLIKTLDVSSELDSDFIKFIASQIEYIIDGDEVYKSDSIDIQDFIEFVEQLTRSQLFDLANFFTTSPRVVGEISYTCSKCGFEHDLSLEGIQNFFD